MSIKVIDLFAGPGGLGEGFSSLVDKKGKGIFNICLSIEKDPWAHKTLLLRHFVRQFHVGNLPDEYYNVIRENNSKKREQKLEELFNNPKFRKQANEATRSAWHAELGGDQYPSGLVDRRIREALGKNKRWMLIGGPPCQAYSMAGRSRVGGINGNDHRVYLYKEYLRIIAAHRPCVFVMENVAGLLSAKIDNRSIFKMIIDDLQNPGQVFNEYKNTPTYKIYSLSHSIVENDIFGNPKYNSFSDYLIKSENYGIPQNRHRVILLGLREDIVVKNIPVLEKQNTLSLKDVIGNLPKLRSGLSKSPDNYLNWRNALSEVLESDLIGDPNFQDPILKDFIRGIITKLEKGKISRGKNYIKCKNRFKDEFLRDWYEDSRLEGVLNHETRSHIKKDLWRYMFASCYVRVNSQIPKLDTFRKAGLKPNHKNEATGIFLDRFRVQLPDLPATTITSHISKDGHYYIHYDPHQCRSLTVREAARIQTFPDNYYFWGPRTEQYRQIGNAVPPYLAHKIALLVFRLLFR